MSASLDFFLGESAPVERLREALLKASASPLPVLLLGESGSGKAEAARVIHRLSLRCKGPFVSINLSAIPDDLMSQELVGPIGQLALTAHRHRPGRLEQAHEGTVFLDELGDTTAHTQAFLLSLLESRLGTWQGDAVVRDLDVRIVSASDQDLVAMASVGRFGADLLHHLARILIRIPPLRERRSDIPTIATSMLTRISLELRRELVLTDPAIAALQEYDFPGNVRELACLLERAAIVARGSSLDVRNLSIRKHG